MTEDTRGILRKVGWGLLFAGAVLLVILGVGTEAVTAGAGVGIGVGSAIAGLIAYFTTRP